MRFLYLTGNMADAKGTNCCQGDGVGARIGVHVRRIGQRAGDAVTVTQVLSGVFSLMLMPLVLVSSMLLIYFGDPEVYSMRLD